MWKQLGVLSLIFAGATLLAGCNDGSSKVKVSSNTPVDNIPVDKPPEKQSEDSGLPITISAEQLAKEFKMDPTEAVKKYKGRTLILEGKMHAFYQISGEPSLILWGYREKELEVPKLVQCFFAKESQKTLEAYKGQKDLEGMFKVKGTGVGSVDGIHYQIRECIFLAQPAPRAPAVYQDKLKAELEKLGVFVDEFGQLFISADAITADGDFKPGIPAKLAQLTSYRSLRALDLPAFGVGAGSAVAAIPGLTQIDLWRTKATDAAIAAFGACPTLERLSLYGDEYPIVSDDALTGLKKLKNLTHLDCQRGKITGAGLAAIAGFTKLEQLNLSDCPVDDAAGPHLAKLTSLQELNLAGSKVTGAGLAALKGLPKLHRLVLDRTGVTDADVKALAAQPQLKSLSLNGTKLTDAGVAPLAVMPELESLSVGETSVSDAGAATLAKSKSLRNLKIFQTKITDAGVASLAGLPKLQSLALYRLPLTDASLESLAKAPELDHLYLEGNNFTEAGLAKFAAARPKVIVTKY